MEQGMVTFVIIMVFCLALHTRISLGLVLEDMNVTLAIPETTMTWDDAAQYCKDNGGHLATVTDDYVQSLLGTLMQIKGVAFLWIGARERDSGWTWADDRHNGKGFNAWAPGHPINKDTEPACAFLRGSEDYVWVDHPCAMQHAFVCEMDIGSQTCRHSGAFLFTGEHGGSCLILHQTAPRSWYKAREYCVENGGRLAVFHNETIYKKFQGHLGKKLQVSGDYWLGLRDSSLQWQDGDDVIRTWWEGGQPSRAGRCVQMEKFGQGVYLWANHDCNRAQSFVCQLKQQETHISKNEDSSPAEVDDLGQRWPCKNIDKGPFHFTYEKFINSILLQAAAFILGIFVMLIPIITICKRKSSRDTEHAAMKSRQNTRPNLDYATPTSDNFSRSSYPPSRSQLEATISDPLPPPPVIEQNIYSIQPMENSHSNLYQYQPPVQRAPQTYELPHTHPPAFAHGNFTGSTNSLFMKPNPFNLVHQHRMNNNGPAPVCLPVPQPKVPKQIEIELPQNMSSTSCEGSQSPTMPGTSGAIYRVKEDEARPGRPSPETETTPENSLDSRPVESRSLYSIAEV